MSYIALPEQLHYLFQKALKVSKQVRTELPMQRGLPDLEHALLAAGSQTFKCVQEAKVLFVGASDINRKFIPFFKNKNFQHLTLCNRSPQVALDLAAQYGLNTLDWREIDRWHDFDWIIFGTKASGYLANCQAYNPGNRSDPKLVIDLCVPRNVHPDIAKLPGVILMNIDEINQTLSIRHQQMADVIYQTEDLIGHYSRRQIGLRHDADIRRMELAVMA